MGNSTNLVVPSMQNCATLNCLYLWTEKMLGRLFPKVFAVVLSRQSEASKPRGFLYSLLSTFLQHQDWPTMGMWWWWLFSKATKLLKGNKWMSPSPLASLGRLHRVSQPRGSEGWHALIPHWEVCSSCCWPRGNPGLEVQVSWGQSPKACCHAFGKETIFPGAKGLRVALSHHREWRWRRSWEAHAEQDLSP